MGIVHIAGPCITIAGRYARQRCSWCGEVLIDEDLENVMVAPAGPLHHFPVGELVEAAEASPAGPLHFPVGELVEVAEGNPRRMSLLAPQENPDGDCKLPLNFCDPRMVR